jgi:hypothetical protein
MHEDRSSSSLDCFVSEIRRELYGPWWTRRRIAAEFRDHLVDSVDSLSSASVSREEAGRLAIDRFGSAALVARSLAHARGVGVPTELTRWGGAAMAVGAVALAAATIGEDISESFRHGAYAEVSFVPRLLCGFGIIAMYRRVRGNLGVSGRRGFQLVVTGMLVGFVSSLAWFEPGGWAGLAVMGFGIAVYLRAVMRTDELPMTAVAMLAASVAATFVVGVGGTVLGSDTGDVASAVGSVGLAAATSWLGVWLWTESGPSPKPAGSTRFAANQGAS